MITLSNGATPLALTVAKLGNDQWIGKVLSEFRGEFVTWLFFANPGGAAKCYSGHYYGADFDSAKADFHKREF